MKERVNYKEGEFVDYRGQIHKFVVAAVSTNKIVEGNGGISITLYDESGWEEDEIDVNKALFIGVSICNPKDEYDFEKGKAIAYKKATRLKNLNQPMMISTRAGFINTEVVEALLDNIVKYIKKDPGSEISGYDEAKKKYLKKVEDDNFVLNSSENLVKLAENIKELTKKEKKDLERLISIK